MLPASFAMPGWVLKMRLFFFNKCRSLVLGRWGGEWELWRGLWGECWTHLKALFHATSLIRNAKSLNVGTNPRAWSSSMSYGSLPASSPPLDGPTVLLPGSIHGSQEWNPGVSSCVLRVSRSPHPLPLCPSSPAVLFPTSLTASVLLLGNQIRF